MNDVDMLAQLRAWRDEFAKSRGYDIHAMAAALRELDSGSKRKVVRGEPRRPVLMRKPDPAPRKAKRISDISPAPAPHPDKTARVRCALVPPQSAKIRRARSPRLAIETALRAATDTPCRARRWRHRHNEREKRLGVSVDAEFLLDFAPCALLERFAGRENAADADIPVAPIHILGRGAQVDEKLAPCR